MMMVMKVVQVEQTVIKVDKVGNEVLPATTKTKSWGAVDLGISYCIILN